MEHGSTACTHLLPQDFAMFCTAQQLQPQSCSSNEHGPWWLVTVSFYGPQGRTGRQSFAVSGYVMDAIIASAASQADLPEARRRRGDAVVDFSAPTLERCKSQGFAL
ncbi:hypothetical protein ACH41H_50015 [Streptomyces sp. NPDC020800]|uniref:hypothetical protein n=1 Tax=Streptomyces sp. NPDC020800 TaxID=3365092 RepID=UPI0037938F91